MTDAATQPPPLRALGRRVGTVRVTIDLDFPMFQEHVDYLNRGGSVLLLAASIEKSVQEHVHRQALEQVRALKREESNG